MEIKLDEKAQGGIISFFIMSMLAVIVALSVTWPVIDSALNVGNATANMSTSAQTLVQLIPLFLALIWFYKNNYSVISSNDIYTATFVRKTNMHSA